MRKRKSSLANSISGYW